MMWEGKDLVVGGIATLLTIVLTKGVPMLATWMKLSTADRKVKASLEAKGYEGVIFRLDARVMALEGELVRMRSANEASEACWEKRDEESAAKFEIERQAHVDCRIEAAELRSEVGSLKRDFENYKRVNK